MSWMGEGWKQKVNPYAVMLDTVWLTLVFIFIFSVVSGKQTAEAALNTLEQEVTCQKAAVVLSEVHVAAKTYDDEDYRKYVRDLRKAFEIPAGDNRLDAFLVYAWFTRDQKTESVTSGFLKECLKKIGQADCLQDSSREADRLRQPPATDGTNTYIKA